MRRFAVVRPEEQCTSYVLVAEGGEIKGDDEAKATLYEDLGFGPGELEDDAGEIRDAFSALLRKEEQNVRAGVLSPVVQRAREAYSIVGTPVGRMIHDSLVPESLGRGDLLAKIRVKMQSTDADGVETDATGLHLYLERLVRVVMKKWRESKLKEGAHTPVLMKAVIRKWFLQSKLTRKAAAAQLAMQAVQEGGGKTWTS